jgi:ectoine hydroxylase-related dioxygenase (phytanoyl-CoA dioxygenase family)
LSANDVRRYDDDGYLVVRSCLTSDECDEIISRARALHARKHVPGCFSRVDEDESGGDPLRVYPRMMHPHRVDDRCLFYLIHPKVSAILKDLLRAEVVALQSMFYWKPPGARGQAFHQDDYYLRTTPGDCIAAWTALEPIDAGNGSLSVFPGSHAEPILPMLPTDETLSFTNTAVVPPPAYRELNVTLEKGDTLFFHGHLIHGSAPNTSKDRFRMSWICHYVPAGHEYNHAYDPAIPITE